MADVTIQTQILDRDELQRFLPDKSFRLIKFFENLATDVSENLPAAIGTSVQGPAGAVDNHVTVFDGATGLLVKDSGVNINSLAPLNSPAFTGIPTAPTASPGTSTSQIATTAFVSTATGGQVTGPASSVDNNVALFNGTTGKVIKDSGVQISALATNAGVAATYAPLASPALTGNPTAPTAAPADNDTSIATTAFVQGEFAARVALGAYFSAHNNGVAQSIPTGAFTVLTLGTEVYDVGNKFASNAWTPPAGRLVHMTGAVGLVTTAGNQLSIGIFKNGALYKQGNLIVPAGTVTLIAVVSCDDVPNGTDVYDLRAIQGSGVAQNTVGAATATYFQGHTVQT